MVDIKHGKLQILMFLKVKQKSQIRYVSGNDSICLLTFMKVASSIRLIKKIKMGFRRKSDEICIPYCARVFKFPKIGMGGNFTLPYIKVSVV